VDRRSVDALLRGLPVLLAMAGCAAGDQALVGWPAGTVAEAHDASPPDGLRDERRGWLHVTWPAAEPASGIARYRIVQGLLVLAEVPGTARQATIGLIALPAELTGGVRIEACDLAARCTPPERSITRIALMTPLYTLP
jgi:hypothetical protein